MHLSTINLRFKNRLLAPMVASAGASTWGAFAVIRPIDGGGAAESVASIACALVLLALTGMFIEDKLPIVIDNEGVARTILNKRIFQIDWARVERITIVTYHLDEKDGDLMRYAIIPSGHARKRRVIAFSNREKEAESAVSYIDAYTKQYSIRVEHIRAGEVVVNNTMFAAS